MKKLLLIICCLCLTSCAALPKEERAFAVVLGIAQGEGWTVQARIPTYQSGGGYVTVTGTGESLPAAFASLENNAPMGLSLDQLRLAVLSDGVADVPAVLHALASREDMRLQAAVAVTSDDLSALMEALEPATGARLSKSLDVLWETRAEEGSAPDATLSAILRMGDRQTPVLMNVTLRDKSVEMLGGWPLTASGTLAEPLDAQEMQLLSLLLGRVKETTLSLADAAIPLRDVSAQTKWTDGHAELTLTARVPKNESLDEVEAALAEQALDLLATLTASGCDPFGLARQAVRQAPLADWPARLTDTAWTLRIRLAGPT